MLARRRGDHEHAQRPRPRAARAAQDRADPPPRTASRRDGGPLPFAAPYIFTGFKLAVAYSFIGVIGAEFIMSSTGIGYEICFAYNNFDNAHDVRADLFVLLLVITINMRAATCGRAGCWRARRRCMTRPRRPRCCSSPACWSLWQLALLGRRRGRRCASPSQTMQRAGADVSDPRFMPHLTETLLAFAQALRASRSSCGLAIGFVARREPARRRGRRAGAGRRCTRSRRSRSTRSSC